MSDKNPFQEIAKRYQPVDVSHKKQRSKQVEDQLRSQKNKDAWNQVVKQVGRRYQHCRVDNFHLSKGEHRSRQKTVINAIQAVGESFPEGILQGQNIVLFGPPGTGKDHLLVGLSRAACFSGFCVRWVRGCDLYSDVRDSYDSQTRESELIKTYTEPGVLVLSDPVPPFGELTRQQSVILYQIIDQRYRDLRPTWVTLNVSSGSQAEDRIGAQTIDRLRDGGLALACDWPSYRKGES